MKTITDQLKTGFARVGKHIRVHVTKQDIAKGKRRLCAHCPLALALIRQFGGKWGVVGSFAWNGGEKYAMSPSAEKFVTAFDFHGPNAVKPASFILILSHPLQRLDWCPPQRKTFVRSLTGRI